VSAGMQSGPRASAVETPVIGVCGVPAAMSWGFWTQPAVLVAETYLAAIRRAGGLPVVLPPVDPATSPVTEVLRALDGVVLAGGTDVSPEVYGEVPGPRMEEVVLERDLYEVAIATAAMQRDLPVLGICRGLQILNVATGGTLHQHLLDQGYADHRPAPGRLDDVTNHLVEVDATSVLARCGLAGLREVNSHHHQGIANVGAGGRPIARSLPDGVVEAVEWSPHRFVVGVQWHPEDPPMDELFAGLVAAARPASAKHLSPAPA
jgi:putative glutamine amidotransferase